MSYTIFGTNICRIMIIACLSLFSTGVLATVELRHGILQAYWQPDWNTDATVNTPKLAFRYFYFGKNTKDNKVVDITVKGSEAEQIAFIKNNFTHIPDNFIKYKEWYVNQYGAITSPKLVKYMECNADNYKAEMQSFTPEKQDNHPQDPITDDVGGCGSSTPYLVLYQLKEGQKQLTLKQAAAETASQTAQVTSDETLAKIKTVDNTWVYVAIYDESAKGHLSNKRGFVKLSDLTPLN